MNRQIVYPGAIPLETDLLNTNKYTMIALAKLASAIMGSSTYVRGLACTPTSPASMVVNVAAGEIYSLANIDGTAYSSLAADTTHSILKQGYVLDAQSFTLTAPSTSGYSINYLIQVTYADTDGGSTVLPYYNASNPSTAWSGPNNSGTSQYTVRQGLCTVSLKAGVAATTGTQKTPSPDTGYTGLYVITVDQGATTVTAANIAVYANAPFIPSTGLVDGIQRKVMTYAADTGTANAYAAQYVPALLSVTDGTEVEFKARAANTGASTFNPNGLGASPILTLGGNALTGGEIPAGSQVRVKWNATLSSWLIVSASGITVAQTLANLGLGTGLTGLVGYSKNAAMTVATASSTATWTADELIVETAIGGTQYRLNNLNLSINLATVGAGGMDVGTAPESGVGALYVIYNPTTNARALLCWNATNSKAPATYPGTAMPAGYTASALVSAWPTDPTGKFVIGFQEGGKIELGNTVMFSTTSTATSSTAVVGSFVSSAIPLNARRISGYCYLLPVAGQQAEVSLLALPVPGTGSRFVINAIATPSFGTTQHFEGHPLSTPQTLLIYAFSTNGAQFSYSFTLKGYEI